jgi:hypothetical protein
MVLAPLLTSRRITQESSRDFRESRCATSVGLAKVPVPTASRKGREAMPHNSKVKMVIAGALLSGAMAVAGSCLGAGTAQASGGPWTWCPGQNMNGGNGRFAGPGPDVQWDMTRCHTWWDVLWGHGNVAPGVWDGPDPPPPEATQKPPCGFPFMCSGTP